MVDHPERLQGYQLRSMLGINLRNGLKIVNQDAMSALPMATQSGEGGADPALTVPEVRAVSSLAEFYAVNISIEYSSAYSSPQ